MTAVFSSLVRIFIPPKGAGFVEYAQFEAGYEALKQVRGFSKLPRAEILKLVAATPICLIVIRSILDSHRRNGPMGKSAEGQR